MADSVSHVTTSTVSERVGKRSGAVQLDQYQKEEYQKQLDRLLARLNETLTGFKYDKKSLALLLAGLQQFLEDALGINALNKPFTKLPASLFHNFDPDGPLHTAATLCAELMKTKGQKRIDWASPASRRENLDLVLRIRQEMLRAGHMRTPRVHILATFLPAENQRLRAAVQRLGGELAQREDSAGVTHVVHPYSPSGDPDDGQEYMRSLELRGDDARIHWWYLPDSYDEWISAGTAPSDVEPDARPPGGRPWHVHPRWVTDSEKYNEWMNEVDYETEEAVAENKRVREAGEDGTQRAAKRSKGAKMNSAAADEVVVPGVVEALGPGAIRRRLVVPKRKVMEGLGTVIDISHGQRQEAAGIPRPPLRSSGGSVSGAAAPAAPHLIPAHAKWFNLNACHAIERAALPDFWTSTARVGLYKAYRTHILTKFREDPRRQLTFSEALRGLEGDANDVRRVFEFLERWGIINCPDPGLVASTLEGPDQVVGADSVLRLSAAPSPAEAAEAIVVGGAARVAVRPGTFRRAAPQAPAVAAGTRFFCNALPHVDCTALRYHCTKFPDVDLCPQAFAEGRFPPGCSSKDFIRLTATDVVPDLSSGWSDQETLLLLEGLELYGDDWAQIAEHVGGRSQLQCIMHLLQLPIEDSLLAPPPSTARAELAGGEDGNGPLPGPLPFAGAANPVTAQLAFLVDMINPQVAAASAKAALETIAQEDANATEGNGAAAADGPLSPGAHLAAASAGLAAGAVKAHYLAEEEEREMQRLVLGACDIQLRRMNAKLMHLEAMDGLVKQQAESLPGARQGLLSNLAALKARPEVMLPMLPMMPQQLMQQRGPAGP